MLRNVVEESVPTPSFSPPLFRRSSRDAAPVGPGDASSLTAVDCKWLERAAELSHVHDGETGPHPNAACILVDGSGGGTLVAEAAQRGMGSVSCEVLAATAASHERRGRGDSPPPRTAYLNLETGDCTGDRTAIDALVDLGVSRVVVGLRHPLLHLRGVAVSLYRAAGVSVVIVGEARRSRTAGPSDEDEARAYRACLVANDALLVRAHAGRPHSTLKYAMTLDGKIAASTGHAAWVSSSASRARVFAARAVSDAVLVGGCTVRRDDPSLTTRREGGHAPARVVLSRTLDLPRERALWDVSNAPTLVMTQRGARTAFQTELRNRGVEVVEFDFLEPRAVTDYLHDRGFLRLFWECGGTLSAPAIQAGVIDRVMAFVAPKIIGGPTSGPQQAPTPVGDLGFVEMSQAVELSEHRWEVIPNPNGDTVGDVLCEGYLATSVPSLSALDESLDGALARRLARTGQRVSGASPAADAPCSVDDDDKVDLDDADASSVKRGAVKLNSSSGGFERATARPGSPAGQAGVAEFYKAFDPWGCLTNFSPHPIRVMKSDDDDDDGDADSDSDLEWPCVEHYYQAQKFAGQPGVVEADALVAAIRAAPSPEEAARIGRKTARTRADLVRPDWETRKLSVMRRALRAKFSQHAGPREVLISTATAGTCGEPLALCEGSPHDAFWGRGRDGRGVNMLGQLLAELRTEMLGEEERA